LPEEKCLNIEKQLKNSGRGKVVEKVKYVVLCVFLYKE
jgi:hypothetical protein